MKRKKILTLLLICPLLLTSCSSTNTIKDVYNYDIKVASESNDYYINVSADQIKNLIEAGNEFTLFIWSRECSHCEEAKPKIEEVLTEDNHSIYAFEYKDNDSEYGELFKYNSEMFPNEVTTPRLFTIKDKEIATEMRAGRLNYTTTFKSSINQITEFTNLYCCSKKAAYKLFKDEFGECEPIIYNTETDDGCKTYREEFIKAQSKSTPTLFIDEAQADDDLINNLIDEGHIIAESEETE